MLLKTDPMEGMTGQDLLTSPTGNDVMVVEEEGFATGRVSRVELDYQPRHQRFLVKEKSYTQQFSHIYNRRLTQLKPQVQREAERR
ncbi:unnamed protein product, partial [Discosporangium mesarthrocarpum]